MRLLAGNGASDAPLPTGLINPILDYDRGPEFDHSDGAGVRTKIPPSISVESTRKNHAWMRTVTRLMEFQWCCARRTGGYISRLECCPQGFCQGGLCNYAGLHDPVCQDEVRARSCGRYLAITRRALQKSRRLRCRCTDSRTKSGRGRFLVQSDADRPIAEPAASNALINQARRWGAPHHRRGYRHH
jgi:hypothetical protein